MLVWNYNCQSYYATRDEHMVKATNKYRNQIVDMLDEWNNSGEEIIPYAIGRLDYSDFDYYCNNLEVKDTSDGLVPDSTFFA